MKSKNLWEQARDVKIQVSGDIVGGFDVGFDNEIPEETKDALMRFVYWVEDHYSLPVTLWVDFKYNHYLIDRNQKRVGYRFYWADFVTYPVFENYDDIPVIELPVRMEHYTIEEILCSFIEAITMYFAWLPNELNENFEPDQEMVEEILEKYLKGDAQ